MLSEDLEYKVQALDIFDEMLKQSNADVFNKIKPYQRKILDKLQDFMNVLLFQLVLNYKFKIISLKNIKFGL